MSQRSRMLPANEGRNVLEVIGVMRGDLRKSDRKVADVVIADPAMILHSTVAETAEIARVSQPTVIRFCVSIGCEGFQDFKLRLAHSLALGTSATHSVISDTDSLDEVVSKIFEYSMTSFDWARHHLDLRALEEAITHLVEAGRIEFFGFGASGIVAQDAQQKFPLFGVPCGAAADSHQQLMAASMLKSGDVAVIISNTGATRSLIEIGQIARDRGAKVIGLLGSAGLIAECCDTVVLIETLDNTDIFTPTISRLAALAIIDVLSTAVALRRGSDHREMFTRMKKRLSNLRVGNQF